MKQFILIVMFFLSLNTVIFSQLPQDYPFKVIIDEMGYAYMTGEFNGDICLSKFDLGGNNHWRIIFPNEGFDRGMDLVLSEEDNIIVTGFVTNTIDNKFDISLIKFLTTSSPQILWNKSFGNLHYDDQAFGIVSDDDNYVYITGYETDKKSNKNIRLLKCSDVNVLVHRKMEFSKIDLGRFSYSFSY